MLKIGMLTELQPEIPIFINVEGFIETASMLE